VFALPAASAPPTSVTTISSRLGRPRLASSIVGSVVTSSSSMIRGLVSRKSARATVPADRRPPAMTACVETSLPAPATSIPALAADPGPA
jgi:hypothetical protein